MPLDTVEYFVGMTLRELEKRAILKAVAFYNNKTAAATSLGIAIRTLANKLEEYEKETEIVKSGQEKAIQDRAARLQSMRGNPRTNEQGHTVFVSDATLKKEKEDAERLRELNDKEEAERKANSGDPGGDPAGNGSEDSGDAPGPSEEMASTASVLGNKT